MRDADDDLRASILMELGHAPNAIQLGKLLQFPINDQISDRSGWCKLFANGRTGAFGDTLTHRAWLWTAIDYDALSPSQRDELAMEVNAVAHADFDVASMLSKTFGGAPKPPPADPRNDVEERP